MRKSNNKYNQYINKSLCFAGALIYVFLFPYFSFCQIQKDTLLTDSIGTVVIKARRNIGNEFITPEKIKQIPSLLGENDLLKYLATLPGVVSINALDPGIYVRGGNSAENAYLVNDVEVANPNHLTGIISVFDPYILGSSTFYKSGYPARYNNHLSSYINMHPTIGDKEKLKGEVTAGLLSSAVKLQGPVSKPEHSFAVSARTSYLQHMARIYNKANEGESMPSYGFSDITLTLNSRLSHRWSLNLFALYTYDDLKLDLVNHNIQHKLKWSTFSTNFKLRYRNEYGFLNITGGLNSNRTDGSSEGFAKISIDNTYTNWLGNLHYDGIIHDNLHYNVGTGLTVSSYDLSEQGKIDAGIYKLYGGLRYNLIENMSFDAGVNFQHYNGRVHSNDFSPRFKLNYQWRNFNFWTDYAKTIQYTTLYPYFTLKSPVDISYPLVKGYKPASSHHYSLGADGEVMDNLYVYAALFLKKMYHAKDFLLNAKSIQENLEELFTEGSGEAKGLELDAIYENRKVWFRVTYTLSESTRKFDKINEGRKFHPPFDLKHNLLINTSFSITDRWKVNAVWTYFSGGYATFPVSIAIAQDILNNDGTRFVPVYRDRYNFKLPDNHRLDVSADYVRETKRLSYKWSFGVYNLYNQQNPTFIYFKPEAKDKYYTQFVPHSKVLLPFIPYLSLTVNW